MTQLPITVEKVSVTTANTELRNRSSESGRHSSPQPTTGTMLITVSATRAHRIRSSMKHCGTSAKVTSRVSPTSTADTMNSPTAPTMYRAEGRVLAPSVIISGRPAHTYQGTSRQKSAAAAVRTGSAGSFAPSAKASVPAHTTAKYASQL